MPTQHTEGAVFNMQLGNALQRPGHRGIAVIKHTLMKHLSLTDSGRVGLLGPCKLL